MIIVHILQVAIAAFMVYACTHNLLKREMPKLVIGLHILMVFFYGYLGARSTGYLLNQWHQSQSAAVANTPVPAPSPTPYELN